MRLKRIIGVAARQIQINSGRSLLASVALSVGIAAVMIMVAWGNGAKKETIRQLEAMGTNLITINPAKITNAVKRKDSTDRITTLKLKDCDAIRTGCKRVSEVVPSVSGTAKVKSGNATAKYMINGTGDGYFELRNLEIKYGALFTMDDNVFSRRVVVLGNLVSQSLFGDENPVGKIVLIGKVPFTVSGVLKGKGIDADGANLDAQLLIPVNTALRRVFNSDYLNQIFVEVSEKSFLPDAEKDITEILRVSHRLTARQKEDDFILSNQLTAIETSEKSARSFTRLITGVSLLALVIGGTGILAVMLLSIKSRNVEIGLRISAGAKRKDIVVQFLAESAFLGLAGGITGVILGLMTAGIILVFSSWQISISFQSVLISLLFSLFTGVIFGVIPARKAAGANPITALQKE
ncbi:MAG TPA: ABC transporter permease [Bacteroidales bacterium]|nr:ABC transporter permease [Bacteroidales bacterium]